MSLVPLVLEFDNSGLFVNTRRKVEVHAVAFPVFIVIEVKVGKLFCGAGHDAALHNDLVHKGRER
jgi:hypothetical protein